LLISHNMADVMAVSDRITVLRLGANAGTFITADTSSTQLVGAITGAVV
jgi:D-xylose transport system ATP-binding protein